MKNDKIEILTPEEAFCSIIYPKIPIGPWNKIYKTSLLRENNIDLIAHGQERDYIFPQWQLSFQTV